LSLKYGCPLSNFAFNCNLRHYIAGGLQNAMLTTITVGLTLQVDPCFALLTLRLLKTFETKMR